MSETKIEWTQQTWNPITGCDKISPGCKNCYAERMSRRLQTILGSGYERGFELTFHPDRLEQPLRWKKPRMVFVCSMSDLFHVSLSDREIGRVFATMHAAKQHTFQILTKRAERMATWSQRYDWPVSHIWKGVSVEDRKHGLPRIEHLRNTPAALRFLSIEPLLEDLGPIDLTGIDWVIVGGESGPSARPCNIAWVRGVVSQCQAAGVPVFVKQLGSLAIGRDEVSYRFINRKNNNPDEWPEDLRVRQMPEVWR